MPSTCPMAVMRPTKPWIRFPLIPGTAICFPWFRRNMICSPGSTYATRTRRLLPGRITTSFRRISIWTIPNSMCGLAIHGWFLRKHSTTMCSLPSTAMSWDSSRWVGFTRKSRISRTTRNMLCTILLRRDLTQLCHTSCARTAGLSIPRMAHNFTHTSIAQARRT